MGTPGCTTPFTWPPGVFSWLHPVVSSVPRGQIGVDGHLCGGEAQSGRAGKPTRM